MPRQHPRLEFVVEYTHRGWMILGGAEPLGPFFAKSHAIDLAEGMASVMRQMGDEVVVRVKDKRPGSGGA